MYGKEGMFMDNSGDYHAIDKSIISMLFATGVAPDSVEVIGSSTIPVWNIDEGGEAFIESATVKVDKSAYDATDNYISAVGLGALTAGDYNFYKDHPLVTENGILPEHFLQVIHGLVAPWGLGLTRVWVPRGTELSNNLAVFAEVLGCNFMAVLDKKTTNQEFAKETDRDDGDVNDEYAFMYADKPNMACIVLYEDGKTNFTGPRDKIKDSWTMAVTVGRVDSANNKYSQLEKFADLKTFNGIERKVKRKLSAWGCKVRGQTITQRNAEMMSNARNSSAGNNGKVLQLPSGTKKKTECPVCEEQTATNGIITWCLMCDWVDDPNDELGLQAEKTQCPFCCEVLTARGVCITCGFSTNDWSPSVLYKCPKHDSSTFYTRRRVSESGEAVYVCAECLEENNMSLEEFNEREMDHFPTLLKEKQSSMPAHLY